ncbi:MAG: YqaE/Pmp3 family membrane protein [Bacteroidales bacterium]|nr:YqaE/Pmp3 family membrane protein [Bacteroidales bacterium]MCF8343990.1 YqaE/Pmp3 family membrane protein [Bacteroidales bacterium]MCF8377776.1 YqaE/Pmp3 family membrane protein [Bacteroidales bacterium]
MPAILKVILAIILPPLAVALEFGVSSADHRHRDGGFLGQAQSLNLTDLRIMS